MVNTILSIILIAVVATIVLWFLSVFDEDLYHEVIAYLIKICIVIGTCGLFIIWALHQLSTLFS